MNATRTLISQDDYLNLRRNERVLPEISRSLRLPLPKKGKVQTGKRTCKPVEEEENHEKPKPVVGWKSYRKSQNECSQKIVEIKGSKNLDRGEAN